MFLSLTFILLAKVDNELKTKSVLKNDLFYKLKY